jgi:hypothetical protein
MGKSTQPTNKQTKRKENKMPIISDNVMKSLLVSDDLFTEPGDKEKFLRQLKFNDKAILDDIVVHIKESVEKTSAALGEPIIVEDKVLAARELVDALKEKYAPELLSVMG